MKTLYVTDLDGTLLEPDKSIKPDNLKLINQLIDEDVNITYATARSLITAKQVIGDINFKLPVIVQNGTFILSPKGDMILGNYLGDSILDTVKAYDISPIVYSQIGKKTYFSYIKDNMSAGVKAFVDDHLDDPRNHLVNTYEDLYEGDIFYLLLIDDYDKLKPLYDLFKEDYYAVFDQEMYSHDWWLEVMSPDASKANAQALGRCIPEIRMCVEGLKETVFSDIMQHYPADDSRRHSAHPVVSSLYSRYQDISPNSIICDGRSISGMCLLHLAGRDRRSDDSFSTTRHRSNGHITYIISSRRSFENDRSPGCSCSSSADTAS